MNGAYKVKGGLSFMKVEITWMTLQDIEDVIEIENRSFSTPWTRKSFEEELLNNKLAVYFVAKADNKAIGYAGMWKVLDEGHITNIAVHPGYRRLKIGSALLKALKQYAKENNIHSITLEVRESNIAAQKLYSKFNFEVVGRRKAYYEDDHEDALIMTCDMLT